MNKRTGIFILTTLAVVFSAGGASAAKSSPAAGTASKPGATSVADICRDPWQCGEWGACDANGLQQRTCSLAKVNCAVPPPPSPVTVRKCDQLQCGNKTTLRERVTCRLKLAPAAASRELELQNLPEECRPLKAAADRQACIEKNKLMSVCLAKLTAGERIACARQTLQLQATAASEVLACNSRANADQGSCRNQARQKVYDLVKFRFDDLIKRAEQLVAQGRVSADVAATFVTIAEQQKLVFNAARTAAAREQVVLTVQAAWQKFTGQVGKR